MLRGARGGTLQSLHRFRQGGSSAEYNAPVLLRPPPGVVLRDGQVVELTVRTSAAVLPGVCARVTFPSLLCRETGKAPNYLTGGMDLMANGVSVEAFLRPNCPVLPRLIVKGPLRRVRDDFARASVRGSGAQSLLEVGGGRGGDCNLWAEIGGVRTVDVVEPDLAAISEYRRRLGRPIGPLRTATPAGCPTVVASASTPSRSSTWIPRSVGVATSLCSTSPPHRWWAGRRTWIRCYVAYSAPAASLG